MRLLFNSSTDVFPFLSHIKPLQCGSKMYLFYPRLFAVPHLHGLHALDLLLQLEDSVHESLGRGWASGHVNVNGDNAITTSHYRIRIMIITSTISTAAHRDDLIDKDT